jgi:hypothetical protein
MNSSLIGKIQKAKRYEQEPERVTFTSLSANFKGEHNTYRVTMNGDGWHCTCEFFKGWQTCSHVMAMQRLLSPMQVYDASPSEDVPSERPLEKVR